MGNNWDNIPDYRNFLFHRNLHAHGVERFETTVTNIAVAFEAVDKNFVHRRGRTKDVVDAQIADDAANVILGPFGNKAIVEGKGEYFEAHFLELPQGVRTVFASTQEHDTIVVAPTSLPRLAEDFAQVIEGLEVLLGLALD